MTTLVSNTIFFVCLFLQEMRERPEVAYVFLLSFFCYPLSEVIAEVHVF